LAPSTNWWADLYIDNVSDGKVRTSAGRTAVGAGNFIYTSQYLSSRTFGLNIGVWFRWPDDDDDR